MSDSTAITALPTMRNNVNLSVTDKVPPAAHIQSGAGSAPSTSPPTLPQGAQTGDMNQVLQDLQQAQRAGMTHLPSRDIPMMPVTIPERFRKGTLETEAQTVLPSTLVCCSTLLTTDLPVRITRCSSS